MTPEGLIPDGVPTDEIQPSPNQTQKTHHMNTNETHGGFFQFPLCLLAQPVPFDELLGRCFFSGVCHYLDVTLGRHWRDSAESREEGMKRARTVIGFSEGSVSHFLENEKAASRFVQEWQQAGRTTCFVRLRKDIYFATRDHGALLGRNRWRSSAGREASGARQAG
jgi:hypothetical protein